MFETIEDEYKEILDMIDSLDEELNEFTPAEREILDDYIGGFSNRDETIQKLTKFKEQQYEEDARADALTNYF